MLVNSKQLEKAAQLLREADPCIANGIVNERPGFIELEDQDENDRSVLVFRLGIIPSTLYRINRRGKVECDT